MSSTRGLQLLLVLCFLFWMAIANALSQQDDWKILVFVPAFIPYLIAAGLLRRSASRAGCFLAGGLALAALAAMLCGAVQTIELITAAEVPLRTAMEGDVRLSLGLLGSGLASIVLHALLLISTLRAAPREGISKGSVFWGSAALGAILFLYMSVAGGMALLYLKEGGL